MSMTTLYSVDIKTANGEWIDQVHVMAKNPASAWDLAKIGLKNLPIDRKVNIRRL
jgi:hypothetical protein